MSTNILGTDSKLLTRIRGALSGMVSAEALERAQIASWITLTSPEGSVLRVPALAVVGETWEVGFGGLSRHIAVVLADERPPGYALWPGFVDRSHDSVIPKEKCRVRGSISLGSGMYAHFEEAWAKVYPERGIVRIVSLEKEPDCEYQQETDTLVCHHCKSVTRAVLHHSAGVCGTQERFAGWAKRHEACIPSKVRREGMAYVQPQRIIEALFTSAQIAAHIQGHSRGHGSSFWDFLGALGLKRGDTVRLFEGPGGGYTPFEARVSKERGVMLHAIDGSLELWETGWKKTYPDSMEDCGRASITAPPISDEQTRGKIAAKVKEFLQEEHQEASKQAFPPPLNPEAPRGMHVDMTVEVKVTGLDAIKKAVAELHEAVLLLGSTSLGAAEKAKLIAAVMDTGKRLDVRIREVPDRPQEYATRKEGPCHKCGVPSVAVISPITATYVFAGCGHGFLLTSSLCNVPKCGSTLYKDWDHRQGREVLACEEHGIIRPC